MLLPHTFLSVDEEVYKVRKHYYGCFTAGELECLEETRSAKSHRVASKPPATRQRRCLLRVPCRDRPLPAAAVLLTRVPHAASSRISSSKVL